MDIRKIKKLIELLHDTDVAEIEISEGEESVRITRGSTNQVVVQTPQMAAPQAIAAPQAATQPTADESSGSLNCANPVFCSGRNNPFLSSYKSYIG